MIVKNRQVGLCTCWESDTVRTRWEDTNCCHCFVYITSWVRESGCSDFVNCQTHCVALSGKRSWTQISVNSAHSTGVKGILGRMDIRTIATSTGQPEILHCRKNAHLPPPPPVFEFQTPISSILVLLYHSFILLIVFSFGTPEEGLLVPKRRVLFP